MRIRKLAPAEVLREAIDRQNRTKYPWETLTLRQRGERIREELFLYPSLMRPDFELVFLLADG